MQEMDHKLSNRQEPELIPFPQTDVNVYRGRIKEKGHEIMQKTCNNRK